jgi:hypothetical protein
VLVHVVDSDDQMMFAFDHTPPVPTTQWKAGQTIEYTRTEFLPVYPYVGDAALDIGLYSTRTQKRLPLAAQDVGQHAYRVAHLQLSRKPKTCTPSSKMAGIPPRRQNRIRKSNGSGR